MLMLTLMPTSVTVISIATPSVARTIQKDQKEQTRADPPRGAAFSFQPLPHDQWNREQRTVLRGCDVCSPSR
jgi:hypothetical protein